MKQMLKWMVLGGFWCGLGLLALIWWAIRTMEPPTPPYQRMDRW
jgi:hypothetical protein